MKKFNLFQKPYWQFSIWCCYPCYTCSKCEYSVGRPSPRCPNCGRKLRHVVGLKGQAK